MLTSSGSGDMPGLIGDGMRCTITQREPPGMLRRAHTSSAPSTGTSDSDRGSERTDSSARCSASFSDAFKMARG